ncbi:carcinoembryonic antigen-related cell adhesion molecule 20-like [Labeo rohita]|uniref:Carcinoembryonic antigen-related cell adhesion molecule 20-like n=1 Tax=Labeo rohita TaxID=84645 RepID=A0A498L1X6_LABRO|nr:carcinoembryonic antigen-related cell adhesion molecule 20-like [Labeo rohita]
MSESSLYVNLYENDYEEVNDFQRTNGEGSNSGNMSESSLYVNLYENWMKDNSPLSPSNSIIFSSDNRSVSISPVQRSDSGEYQCTYTNPVSSETAKLSLIVNYGPDDVSIKGEDVVDLGVRVSLSCSANSKPSASFSWKFNGSDTGVTTDTFIIDQTDFTHSGDYVCTALNRVTKRSAALKHTLRENITNVRLVGPEELLIEGESSANITTEGTGTITSVQWMKDNSPLSPSDNIIFSSDNRSVSISPVQRSDSGEYQCTYSNPVSSETVKLGLIINYGPDGVSIQGEDVVDLGVRVSLSCSANSEPSPSFSWRFNGSDTGVTTDTFIIDQTDFTHSGDYECTAWNNVTERSASQKHALLVQGQYLGEDLQFSDTSTGGTLKGETSLEVFENITNVRLVGPEEPLIEGESSANITSEGTGTITSVQWMKDNSPLSPSDSIIFSSDNRSVSIILVQRSDSGEYQCTYSNPVSSETVKLGLIINYGPDNVSITGPNVVDLRVRVSLFCSANSEPSASFSWRFNGSDTGVTTDTFTIYQTDFTNSGDYECTAWNNVTERSASQKHVLLVQAQSYTDNKKEKQVKISKEFTWLVSKDLSNSFFEGQDDHLSKLIQFFSPVTEEDGIKGVVIGILVVAENVMKPLPAFYDVALVIE